MSFVDSFETELIRDRSRNAAWSRSAAKRRNGQHRLPSFRADGRHPEGRGFKRRRLGALRRATELSSPVRTREGADEEATYTAYHQDIGEWHGKTLVDRDAATSSTTPHPTPNAATGSPAADTPLRQGNTCSRSRLSA